MTIIRRNYKILCGEHKFTIDSDYCTECGIVATVNASHRNVKCEKPEPDISRWTRPLDGYG